MPAAAIGLATAAVSAYSQKRASDKAAGAVQKGNDAAIAEQRRQYDQTRQDQMPWLDAGRNALGQLQALNSGDFSSFKESPDYEFAFDQGNQAITRAAAARGGLRSGGTDADLMRFGQGLATQNYSNYYNRLAGLANVGQSSAQSLGGFGAGAANQIGGYQANTGAARASSYQQQGNALAGLAGAAGGAFNNWYQQNRAMNPGGSAWYLGNQPGRG